MAEVQSLVRLSGSSIDPDKQGRSKPHLQRCIDSINLQHRRGTIGNRRVEKYVRIESMKLVWPQKWHTFISTWADISCLHGGKLDHRLVSVEWPFYYCYLPKRRLSYIDTLTVKGLFHTNKKQLCWCWYDQRTGEMESLPSVLTGFQ